MENTMPNMADLIANMDEFDPTTAQILLGDNPHFREAQRDILEMIRERVVRSGAPRMITQLAELEDAHRAYELDPKWVGGPGHLRWHAARTPLLQFLGLIDA